MPEWVAWLGRTRLSERLAFALGAKSLEKGRARGPGTCCLQRAGWGAGHAHYFNPKPGCMAGKLEATL